MTFKNGLGSQITTAIIIVIANVIISYFMANKVANTMVIRDNIRIEFLEKQAEQNRIDVGKLDENKVSKDVFNSAIIIIKEQNDITRQMITAHERRNETEFLKLQNQYDILEKLFEKEIARFRGSTISGGGQIQIK